MAKQRFRKIKQGKVSTPSMDEKQSAKPKLPYASARLRMKAFLTDTFMLMMPIMYIVVYFVMGSLQTFSQHRLLGWVYIFVPLVIIQTLFMGISGQTPGYRAYGLKLIDIHTGEKPSWGIILFRNLAAILSALTLVGWLMMYFRKDGRTLHDLLSGTAVIVTS
jgi:uncharacterized RDD family membrane protein YckC